MRHICKLFIKRLNKKKYFYNLDFVYKYFGFNSSVRFYNGLLKRYNPSLYESYCKKIGKLKSSNEKLFNEYLNNNILIIKDILKNNDASYFLLFVCACILKDKKRIKIYRKKMYKTSYALNEGETSLTENFKLFKKYYEFDRSFKDEIFSNVCRQRNFKIVKFMYKEALKYYPKDIKIFTTNGFFSAINNYQFYNAKICYNDTVIDFRNDENRKKNYKFFFKLNQKYPKVKSINNKNIRKLITKYIPKNPF